MASENHPPYNAAELDYRLQAHLAMANIPSQQKPPMYNVGLAPTSNAIPPFDPRLLGSAHDGHQYHHSMDRARSHSGGTSEYSGGAAYSNLGSLAPRSSGTFDAGSASSRSLSMVFSDHTHDYPESDATSRSFASPPPGLPRSGSQNSGIGHDFVASGAVASSQGRSTPAIELSQQRSGGSSPHPSSADSSGRSNPYAQDSLRSLSSATSSQRALLSQHQNAASQYAHHGRQQWSSESDHQRASTRDDPHGDNGNYPRGHDADPTYPQDARNLGGLQSPPFHLDHLQRRNSPSLSPLGPSSPSSDVGLQGSYRTYGDEHSNDAPHSRAGPDQHSTVSRPSQSMTPVLRTGSVAANREGNFAAVSSVTPPLGSNEGHSGSASVSGASASGAGPAAASSEFSIFIGDLSPDLGEADLVQQFLAPPPWPPSHPFAIAHAHALQKKGLYGPPPRVGPRPFLSTKSAKIMTDPANGLSRGFGFVRFASEADCSRALIEMQGVIISPINGLSPGRPLRVCTATPKNRTPGGEMQSSQMLPPGALPTAAASGLAMPYMNAASPLPSLPQSSASLHALPPQYTIPSPSFNVVSPSAQVPGGGRSAHGYSTEMLSPGLNLHGAPYLSPDSLKSPSAMYHRGSLLGTQSGQLAIPPPRMAASFSGPSGSPLGTPSYGLPDAGAPSGPSRFTRTSFPPGASMSGHSPTSSTSASVTPSANATASALDPHNTTVFVGGLSSLISEDTLKTFFVPFGEITYVKIPPGKGCGFVQFVRKADAERAIERMQGFPIGGGRIRLSWGRSQGDKAAVAAAGAAQRAAQLGHLAGLAGLTGLSSSQLAQLAGLSSALNAAQSGAELSNLAGSLPRGNMMSAVPPMGGDLNSTLLRQLSSAAAAGIRNDAQGGSQPPLGLPVGIDRVSAYGVQPSDEQRGAAAISAYSSAPPGGSDADQGHRALDNALAGLSLSGRPSHKYVDGSQHRHSSSHIDSSQDSYHHRDPSHHEWEQAPIRDVPLQQAVMSEHEYMQRLQQRGRPDLAHSNPSGGRRHSPHSLMQSNVFSPFSPSVSPAMGGNMELRGDEEIDGRAERAQQQQQHQLAQHFVPEAYSQEEYSRYNEQQRQQDHYQQSSQQRHRLSGSQQQRQSPQGQRPGTASSNGRHYSSKSATPDPAG